MPDELQPNHPAFFIGFERERVLSKKRRHLPHWEQEKATYFVTFRLFDSLPKSLLDEWKEGKRVWLAQNPPPWNAIQRRYYQTNFPQKMEDWLDQGMGSRLLGLKENRDCLMHCLRFRDGLDYFLGDWVIMPNHVHLLVRPCNGRFLSEILQAWKGVSAHRVNKRSGRTGSLWMDESFTHIIRNFDKLKRAAAYIRQNPAKARLKADEYSLDKGKAEWFTGEL